MAADTPHLIMFDYLYIFDEAFINHKRNDNCGKDAAITKTEIKLQL